MNSSKMNYIAAGIIFGALAFKFGPKLVMMAENTEVKEGLLNKVISFFGNKEDFKPHMMYDPKTGKGYEAKTMDDHLRMEKMGYIHEKPRNYDYGSIEIPEPVSGVGGKSIGQTSLQTSVAPIAGIGQNSSGRIIGGY
jgi:hypothetical protein